VRGGVSKSKGEERRAHLYIVRLMERCGVGFLLVFGCVGPNIGMATEEISH